VTDPILA